MFRKSICALTVASFVVSGCAASSDSISAQYVSPVQYQSYNCNQIREEIARVSYRVNELAGVQDSQRTKDSVALGVGLVIFWPALFFMIGKDKAEELGRLKGEYEALEKTAIQKECNISKEIEAAREMEQQRKEENKAAGKTQSAPNE
ncbi:MAG: hypothetical protein NZ828_12380 [Alphaproteobacteria bacterium]|nr:hypothetical protein [Alphaproteobacteria bacterium]